MRHSSWVHRRSAAHAFACVRSWSRWFFLLLKRMQCEKDNHLFEALQIRSGPDADLLKGTPSLDLRDDTHGQIARENAIHSAGDHVLTDVHGFICRDVFHRKERIAGASHRTLNSGLREHGAYAALPV